jgi:hypothetical protein
MTGRWREGLRTLFTSTFGLTMDERKIVLLILALALLGLGAKAWHRHRLAEEAPITRDQPE